jgi:hypothetical protein
MLSKIKSYALAILGMLAAFAGFMWQMTRAKHEEALKDGIEDARETEQKATKTMVEGLENEAKITQNDTAPDRNHFN